ncbi:unnamed protein product [Spirodela intermedia]|uniref:Uncharacterized protein n=1 Tax=Spirodela intermedia TaxID=51605 RepID=A0A7I8IZH0_SPIIN|nr:unnamed protein product [Spirodela intermedia]CAA6663278.1 unnamed protein product [Spirodela intermedia]
MSTEGTAGTEPPEIISEGPRREKARRGNSAGAARPQFTVLGAGLYELNTSSSSAGPTAVSASIQFTVSIHNPSARSSASFDRLAAYVDFNGEAITQPSPLPPLYLSRDGTGAVSPVLGGGGVSAGEKYGAVGLRLVVAGRVKYKAGPFHSPWRRVNARCELVMGLNKGVYGPATLLGTPDCSVDI